jgi:hypothetical protein
MYANVTEVRGSVSDLEATAGMAAESLLSWLREFDGYKGFIVLADEEGGRARFMTFWEDRHALEKSAQGRKQVRERLAKTAGVDIESARAYTVLMVDGFVGYSST